MPVACVPGKRTGFVRHVSTYINLFCMSDQVNGVVLREDFKVAKKIFDNAFNPVQVIGTLPNGKKGWVANTNYDPTWDSVSAFSLTQSTIRLEQPIVSTSANYLFPILSNIQNQAQQFPSEIRLNLQDSFVPTRIGVYVGLPSGTADTTFPLFTYFNPIIFGVADAAAMEAFYNGQLKIMINNKQFVNGYGLYKHRRVPQTQQTATPLAAAVNVTEFDGSVDGTYPMQPFTLLLGSQNIQISIQLPNAITAFTANSRIILIFEGVLAQNSTVVN